MNGREGSREGRAPRPEKSHEKRDKKFQHQGRGIPFVFVRKHSPLLLTPVPHPTDGPPLSCGAMESVSRISAAGEK